MLSIDETDGTICADFGSGTVRICRAYLEGDPEKVEKVILLSPGKDGRPAGEVGDVKEDCPLIGSSSVALPGPKVKLVFHSVAGIDALMAELSLIRQTMSETTTELGGFEVGELKGVTLEMGYTTKNEEI